MRSNRYLLSVAKNLGRLFPQSLPTRLLLIFFAVLIQIGAEVLSWFAGSTRNPVAISFAVILWGMWFGVVFLIAKPSVDALVRPYRKTLFAAAMFVMVALALMGIGEVVGIHVINSDSGVENELAEDLSGILSYNDATALNHQASLQFLDGANPYSNSNIVDASEEFEVPLGSLTPLRQGDFAEVFPYPTEEQLDEALTKAKASRDVPPLEFESKVSYPAGAFLLQAPLVYLGMEDTRLFYLLCAIIMMGIIFWLAPGRLRALVVAAFLTNLVLWNLIGSGSTDTLYVLLILLGWILMREHLLLSAFIMGLAATTKQIAWLFVLFYLILVLRQLGWRRSLQSLGLIAATFTVINMPFIFDAPEAWLEGVLAPIIDPMFPRGDGIVTFSIAGILPPSSWIFTSLEVAVLMLASVWYYRNCLKYPQAGLLLAVLPLFFAWRSYSCYFYFASLLVFGAVIIEEYRKPAAGGQSKPIPATCPD